MSDIILMSVKEIASLLGLDRALIASWNHANRLPKPEWLVSGGKTPVWTEQTIKEWANSDEFVLSKIDTRAKSRLSKWLL